MELSVPSTEAIIEALQESDQQLLIDEESRTFQSELKSMDNVNEVVDYADDDDFSGRNINGYDEPSTRAWLPPVSIRNAISQAGRLVFLSPSISQSWGLLASSAPKD